MTFERGNSPPTIQRRIRFTGSLLARQEGDHSHRVHGPRDPSRPEILIPDADWLAFAMIFAFGSGIISLAA